MVMISKSGENYRSGSLRKAFDDDEEKEVFWRHSTHFVLPQIKYLARIASRT